MYFTQLIFYSPCYATNPQSFAMIAIKKLIIPSMFHSEAGSGEYEKHADITSTILSGVERMS